MDFKLKVLQKLTTEVFFKGNFRERVSKMFQPKCYKRREPLSSHLGTGRQITKSGNTQFSAESSKLFTNDYDYDNKMADHELREMMKQFVLSEAQIQEIYKSFCCEVLKGLAKDTHSKADIKCFITYVHNLPTGKEKGQILALDLGGTNFRVLLVTLKGPGQEAEMVSNIYAMSKEIMVGPGTKLFDYIAECLAVFVKEKGLENENLPLGFTFSFPCEQVGLKSAILKRWTKGYSADGVINEDIGRLLNEALERRGDVKINLAAIVNDTTGTLMSCAHQNPNCRIGVIVGTGCNACYVEKTENVQLLSADLKKKNKYVIINTEWGAFGDSGLLDFIRTEADRIVDKTSPNPGYQIYEKMISGMYLGNLLRYCLIKAIECKLIFNECSDRTAITKTLETPDTIKTLHISSIEEDKFPDFTNSKKFITELFNIQDPSEEDCQKIHYICECISKRAAILAGIGISGLVNKIDESSVTIGVDGTLYRKHPKFGFNVCQTMKKLVNPKNEFETMISEDGSGLGAAIIAAVSH